MGKIRSGQVVGTLWTIDFLQLMCFLSGCLENAGNMHPSYLVLQAPATCTSQWNWNCWREVARYTHSDFSSFPSPSEQGRELSSSRRGRRVSNGEAGGRETPISTKGGFLDWVKGTELLLLALQPLHFTNTRELFDPEDPTAEVITHYSLGTPHLKGSTSDHLRGRRAGPFVLISSRPSAFSIPWFQRLSQVNVKLKG